MKTFRVTIDQKFCDEYFVKAKTQAEAKKKAWDKHCSKKPKKNKSNVWVDEWL